jgi:uncharacterized protein (DUF2267 family)
MSPVMSIQKAIDSSHEWVKVLMQDYTFHNENKAFVILRATLKALRDRLPIENAVHLGSVLPVLIRGFYYDAWSPKGNSPYEKVEYDFIELVAYHLNGHDDIKLDEAVPITLKLIFDMMDKDSAQALRLHLPLSIKSLFPQ